jgi:hypothetical protein
LKLLLPNEIEKSISYSNLNDNLLGSRIILAALVNAMKIKDIRLGIPAAERDIKRDPSRNLDFHRGLLEYFVESDVYHSVARGLTNILIGNRGSGKSAIFQVLAARERRAGKIVVEIKPEDYSYNIFRQNLKTEIEGSWEKQGAYTVAWKYILYVTVMKEISERHTNIKTKSIKRIKEYLRDNQVGSQDGILDRLLSYMKRIEEIKIVDSGFKAAALHQIYSLEEIHDLLNDLANLCESRNVLVFVDELDQGWDASDNARQFVAGLFRAAISVNTLTTNNLRVLISLRRELYDNIPEIFEDAQKVRDLFRFVEWDEAGLRRMIEKRIQTVLPRPGWNQPYRTIDWYTIFPATMGEQRQDSFSYIIDRTLYRPRELIQFCNQCLEEAPTDAEVLDQETIAKAERIYSRDRAQDIAAEYRFQYPGLGEIFETFRAKPCVINREDIELHCLEITAGQKVYPTADSWVKLKDYRELMSILWQIGFLRAQFENVQQSDNLKLAQFLGSHQIATDNVSNVSKFMIHHMFWSYYDIRSVVVPMS